MDCARFVGRVGALALALGIGAAVASAPGIAGAESSNAGGTNSSASDGTASSTTDADVDHAAPGSGSGHTEPADDDSGPVVPDADSERGVEVGADGVDPKAGGGRAGATSPVTSRVRGGDGGRARSVRDAGDEDLAGVRGGGRHDLPVQRGRASDDPLGAVDDATVTARPAVGGSKSANGDDRADTVRTALMTVSTVAVRAPTHIGVSDDGRPAAASQRRASVAVSSTPVAAEGSKPATVLAEPARVISSMVSAVLTPTTPTQPVGSPLLGVVLAWVRGEVKRWQQTLFNQTPTLAPVQQSQDQDNGQVHGSFGGADVDSDTLTYSVPVTGAGAPTKGTVTIDQAGGGWTYTPDPEWDTNTTINDSFTVTVSDASQPHLHLLEGLVDPLRRHSATATVDVTVADLNDPPQSVGPGFSITSVDRKNGMVSGNVAVIDPENDALTYGIGTAPDPDLGTLSVDEGSGAWSLTLTPQARLGAFNTPAAVPFTISATDNQPGNTAAVMHVAAPIPPAEAALTDTINVGPQPTAVAVDATGKFVYVANETNIGGGSVTVIETATGETTSHGAGDHPTGVAVAPNGLVYVANSGDNWVTVINPTDSSTTTIDVGASPQAIVARSDGHLFVVNSDSETVSVIDSAGNGVVATVPVGYNPSGVAVGPGANGRVYVTNSGDNTLTVIDTTTGSSTTTIDVGEEPSGVAVGSDGRIYVANATDNTVMVIDTTNNTTTKTTIGVGERPAGVAIFFDRLYVANSGDDTVSVIDTTNYRVLETVPVGSVPIGLATFRDKIYVANSGDNTVSVLTSVYDGVHSI